MGSFAYHQSCHNGCTLIILSGVFRRNFPSKYILFYNLDFLFRFSTAYSKRHVHSCIKYSLKATERQAKNRLRCESLTHSLVLGQLTTATTDFIPLRTSSVIMYFHN